MSSRSISYPKIHTILNNYIYIYLSEPRSNECFSSLLFSTILNYFSPFFLWNHTNSLFYYFSKTNSNELQLYPAFFLFCLIYRVASFFFEPWQHAQLFFIMFDPLYIYPPPSPPGPPILLARLPPFALHQYSCLHYFWTIQRMYLTFTCNK